jgi:transposase
MLKTFEYRLCPAKQQRLLSQRLEERRWSYNDLLAERRDTWEQRQESVRYYDQAMSLPTLNGERPALAGVHQHRRRIVATFDLIAVQDLSVNRMAHNHCLSKSIHDAAWRQVAELLSYTAAWAGRS